MTAASRVAASGIEIRTAQAADLDAVAAIEREAFGDPWSRRSFADLLPAGHVIFLVAVRDARVIAYAVALVAGLDSELANLAVVRAAQGSGVGRRLLDTTCHAVRSRGSTDMWLEVRASNAAALALYESARFVRVGRRTGYYARPVEDAIVMRLDLRSQETLHGSSEDGPNPGIDRMR
jgi:ribosomal-protein-alanine N-acetyltransferase